MWQLTLRAAVPAAAAALSLALFMVWDVAVYAFGLLIMALYMIVGRLDRRRNDGYDSATGEHLAPSLERNSPV